jgi:hypothetical protein
MTDKVYFLLFYKRLNIQKVLAKTKSNKLTTIQNILLIKFFNFF